MTDLFGGELRTEADDLLDVLWLTPGWPKNEKRDREFCMELMRQFPDKDLADELGQWRVWLLDKGDEEMMKGNVRARVRNWCSGRFVQQRRGAPRSGPGPRAGRTSTSARPASAFQGAPSGLQRW